MSSEKKPTPPSAGSGGTPAGCTTTPCPKKCEPNNKTTTTGNRIDIVFEPDESCVVTKCEKIVHVQFIRAYTDGKMIKHSDYSSAYKHKEKITTSDGWAVDCLAGETTPDYQQGTGDGKKNGGSTNATMMDAPKTGGGDKGFYNATTNPTGWKTFRFEFAVYAWCMKGTDCGKWYEGSTWEYKKTWEDHRDGKNGESTIINKNVTSQPTAEHIAAFDLFNKEHKFVPCK